MAHTNDSLVDSFLLEVHAADLKELKLLRKACAVAYQTNCEATKFVMVNFSTIIEAVGTLKFGNAWKSD